MLSTDHFVFIHLHKSGGTFINRFLMRYGNNPKRLGYHLPYREIPSEYRTLPVIGTLRNPLAYYVSWYHFQKSMPRPNFLYNISSNRGTLDFNGTIRNLLWIERDEGRLQTLERVAPDVFQQRGINITKHCLRELRGCGFGFYSYLHQRMLAGATSPHLIPTEGIRSALPSLMESLGSTISDEGLAFIRQAPNINASSHNDMESYYDNDLKQEVLDREAPVVNALTSLGVTIS